MGIGGPDNTAFSFEGRWQDFLKIGITNAFLNIVTIGIYRFWGTTRERRYLWSQTRFIDDRLEWTGTGLELFIGFVAALVLLGIPLIILQLIAQGMILQGQEVFAAIFGVMVYLFLLSLAGFAVFRGLRYRLSRTYWHGIHGGSDNPGFAFAISYLWKSVVGFIALGLLIPWASTKLWKERWDAMSFGPHSFRADPAWRPLMKRFALFYIAPLLLVGLGIWAGFSENSQIGSNSSDVTATLAAALIGLFFIIFYFGLPLIALIYYAAYLREVISSLRLSSLSFSFKARSKDWIWLTLGNFGLMLLVGLIGIVIATIAGGVAAYQSLEVGNTEAIGVGTMIVIGAGFVIPILLVAPLLRYRNWAFFIRHLEAGGEVNLDALTQSTTRELSQGEGLLDAFDMGAM